ncbi:hypothetical protein JKP88DRAFT_250106 [Tribonema minus]|uniref:Uncharacterized protein n=1 Tax=Tribonema minus TaxID=303371 RepID=A0A835YIZ6_9STRA|nr:hypothetical protein JKP88DRAFT_250106 [Tribonema minus]
MAHRFEKHVLICPQCHQCGCNAATLKRHFIALHNLCCIAQRRWQLLHLTPTLNLYIGPGQMPSSGDWSGSQLPTTTLNRGTGQDAMKAPMRSTSSAAAPAAQDGTITDSQRGDADRKGEARELADGIADVAAELASTAAAMAQSVREVLAAASRANPDRPADNSITSRANAASHRPQVRRSHSCIVLHCRVVDTCALEADGSPTPAGLFKPFSGVGHKRSESWRVSAHEHEVAAFQRQQNLGGSANSCHYTCCHRPDNVLVETSGGSWCNTHARSSRHHEQVLTRQSTICRTLQPISPPPPPPLPPAQDGSAARALRRAAAAAASSAPALKQQALTSVDIAERCTHKLTDATCGAAAAAADSAEGAVDRAEGAAAGGVAAAARGAHGVAARALRRGGSAAHGRVDAAAAAARGAAQVMHEKVRVRSSALRFVEVPGLRS